MSSKPYTIVFDVVDDKKFRKLLGKLLETMNTDEVYRGARVTGAGQGDSMTEAEAYRHVLENEGLSAEHEAQAYFEDLDIIPEGMTAKEFTKQILGH